MLAFFVEFWIILLHRVLLPAEDCGRGNGRRRQPLLNSWHQVYTAVIEL